MNSHNNSTICKTMEPEQFNQVIDSILDGKYSWACVLILRFAGYNPAHYIPYRTYYRLMKENRLSNKKEITQAANNSKDRRNINSITQEHYSGKTAIQDLNYLETLDESISISGGLSCLVLNDFELDYCESC